MNTVLLTIKYKYSNKYLKKTRDMKTSQRFSNKTDLCHNLSSNKYIP